MFAMVRGSRGMKFDWFKDMRGSLSQPFKSEDDLLNELRLRVGELQKSDKQDQD